VADTPDPTVPSWDRPHPSLLRYYVLLSLVAGPLFFVILIPLYFRYHSMRYVFDDEGVTMRWGVLFRREISLAYARLQDIHLTSNAVERWLGLAKVQLQTASGSAKAEMTIEGLPMVESVRDFLYGRMRGSRVRVEGAQAGRGAGGTRIATEAGDSARLVQALQAVTDELAAVRVLLERSADSSADRQTSSSPGEDSCVR
jgi:membrane protein YdbS with pleckstrin-like domain